MDVGVGGNWWIGYARRRVAVAWFPIGGGLGDGVLGGAFLGRFVLLRDETSFGGIM